MSCEYYQLAENVFAKFSDVDDETRCLCNLDLYGGAVPDPSHIKALALLGAALIYTLQAAGQGKIADEEKHVTVQSILPEQVIAAISQSTPDAT